MNPAVLKTNLNVLRRHDPAIIQILDSASHCVVYDFAETKGSWVRPSPRTGLRNGRVPRDRPKDLRKKRGIEGTLFVFARDRAPFHGFFVMNRLSTDNLLVLLPPNQVQVDLQGDYIMYKQQSSETSIQGLWIYEEKDKTRLAKVLMDAVRGGGDVPQAHAQQGKGDLMSLFQRAVATGVQPAIPPQTQMMPQMPPQQRPPPQMVGHMPQQMMPPQPQQHGMMMPQNVYPFMPPPPQFVNPVNMDLAPHSAVSTPEAQRRAGHQILAALGVPRRQEPQPVRESQASSTFQSLEEMWRTLESLGPMRGPKLEYHEFRGRFLAWVQNPVFIDKMFLSYQAGGSK